ncbi:exostosin-2-like [Lytechinus pictus]|uniref:exostosin-2-like n=1 Tax=Lytechinus pictus TaxID=7653 RepID=UPI0030BA1AF2
MMKKARGPKLRPKYHSFYLALFSIILAGIIVTGIFQFWPHSIELERQPRYHIESYNNLQEVKVSEGSPLGAKTVQECHYHDCFDVYRCGSDTNRISVYIYPMRKYVDESGVPITGQISREFYEVLNAIANSPFYTSNADQACLLVPSIDLLNQNTMRVKEMGQVLNRLPRWNGGTNHLLINMLPGTIPDFNTALDVPRGNAILAGGGFSSWTYRPGYDVSIPVFSTAMSTVKMSERPFDTVRPYLAVSTQAGIHDDYRTQLLTIASTNPDFQVLDECKTEEGLPDPFKRCQDNKAFSYPHILQDATFCIVLRRTRLGQAALSDALQAGCIPVIISDAYILPFSEVIDWKRASLVVREDRIPDLPDILHSIELEHIHQMRRQVRFLWKRYFSSMANITLTTLQIINDRVFPYKAKDYDWWNEPTPRRGAQNPLFFPIIPPKSHGFTAVVLTYDREQSLFEIIKQISQTPSLSKVLVVWNHQEKTPPPAERWPKINKPLKVVQTKENKLSNRFYPYDEIETECILAIDDDIIMLTPDELEFGYGVWREFPDRLVGFPSRLHLWDEAHGKWKYESEWMNDHSMVLTGAAFYHKYFSYAYTHKMSPHIKTWVDAHMNCEDIAMNFLIANITGKAPMKVTPRKKFKCPECTSVEMISADLNHMVERSECIMEFEKEYGMMPLKTVQFRADPVLYKDNVPEELKRYHTIGSL